MTEIKTIPNVLILTVRMDERSQAFFNELRDKHFPPDRNYLKAHLTLFHQLPDLPETIEKLKRIKLQSFEMPVTGLINLGAGVAFRIDSELLNLLRHSLVRKFITQLNAQDKQGFRAHVTIQNKTTPENAKVLLAELSAGFSEFKIKAIGLDLWHYLGGPWSHKAYFSFEEL